MQKTTAHTVLRRGKRLVMQLNIRWHCFLTHFKTKIQSTQLNKVSNLFCRGCLIGTLLGEFTVSLIESLQLILDLLSFLFCHSVRQRMRLRFLTVDKVFCMSVTAALLTCHCVCSASFVSPSVLLQFVPS